MGIIHVAEWKGIKVAIKEASDHVISKEVEIYNRMKGFEGVVQFYGVTYPPGLDKLCIVTKYAEQGSLSWHLRVGFHKLTWADKLTLATQISASIARLHKEGVFHRDLHGGNILIDEAGNAMLTDFGASTMEERVVRSVDEYAISTTTNSEGQYKFVSQKMPALDSPDKDEATTTGVPDGHGPAEDKSDPLIGVMAYIAPERFRNPRYFDARCDIYSLGVLLWELTSGHSAFSKTPQDVQFALSILNGKREQAIPGTPESYRALYECCWDTNPEMRPSLDEILSTLEEVRQELSPEELAATSERSTVPNGDGESDFEESLSVPRPTSDYQEYLIPESEEQS
ncbi:kinase-like domain-containing protein [Lobosporangium transversale]|uniref:Kinase-like domain-containing protein n=1 Tax=Lobosporangium transversale TaxID=64571 RepID=A0A1Y2GDQ1_9FUNG|nr:kinase-like domain-containing protein [Lobosporangium transversale]ORZ07979.1 kinase-like domain-containing protein [Lobosporangium transversale]|eukprot:XP_021878213.1 kinase-like domain-containing protein [Lobosporangium transversale]